MLKDISAEGGAEGDIPGTENGTAEGLPVNHTVPLAFPAPDPQSHGILPGQGSFGGLVVLSDSSWKVSDEDQGGWSDVGFDDASWTNAEAPWESWDHDDLSPAQPMWHHGRHDYDSTWFYFRKSFFIPATMDTGFAHLNIQVDDDSVLYVNGHEVARDESGTTETPSTYDILPYLNVGENVVAVQAIDSFGGYEGVTVRLGVAPSGDGSVLWAPAVGPVAKSSVGGSGLRRGATISGKVIDSATGRPISNARIVAKNIDRDESRYESDTDANGLYTLVGLAPGRYGIRAEADRQGYTRMYYDDRLYRDKANLVTVRDAGAIEGVDFALNFGATISGRVTDAATGRPIDDVSFSAGPKHRDHVSWTDAGRDGYYILRGIPNGTIEIEVQGQGYIRQRFSIRVADFTPVEGADIQLQLGGTISGRVTDASSGQPASNVGIGAGPIGQGHLSWSETDHNGLYVLTGLPNGEIEIDARGRGYMQQHLNVLMADFGSVQGADIALNFGASISGRVTDANTGLPVSNVNLRAGPVERGHVSWADSNSNGYFFLEGLPEGTIEVELEGRGYIKQRVNIRVTGSEPLEGVAFELTFGASI